MEICSTFLAANPMNMVAWGRIELPTRGFSTLIPNLRVQYFQRVVT
jgi:hypothetical protein